ncbi:MAG: pilin [Saezia sp.]
MTEEKVKGSRIKKWLITAMVLIGLFLGAHYAISVLSANWDWGTSRTLVAEGLVLSSSAKNLVVDNAVNGLPFDAGWEPLSPTKNTQSITINGKTGAIAIITSSSNGGAIMLLTPTDPNGALVSGRKPEGAIRWRCTVVDQGSTPIEKIPAECRS